MKWYYYGLGIWYDPVKQGPLLPFPCLPAISSPFIYNFGDCVSDRNSSPFNLLLGKPRSDADLQCRLKLPSNVFGRCINRSGHTLEPRYQHTVCQRLES